MNVSTVYSAAGVEIFSKPFLVGEELERLSERAATDLLASVDKSKLKNATCLEILNGGRYYRIPEAYRNVTGEECTVGSLRAKRRVDEASGDWAVDVWERNFHVADLKGPLIIGDTIATGTTLHGVLKLVVTEMQECSNFQDIIIVTIAGAANQVATKLADLHATLASSQKSITLVFANAQLALASNGTDLSLGPGSTIAAEASTELNATLGDFTQHMKCVIWDWGDRFTKQQDHLAEVWEFYHGIESTPSWIMDGIKQRRTSP